MRPAGTWNDTQYITEPACNDTKGMTGETCYDAIKTEIERNEQAEQKAQNHEDFQEETPADEDKEPKEEGQVAI